MAMQKFDLPGLVGGVEHGMFTLERVPLMCLGLTLSPRVRMLVLRLDTYVSFLIDEYICAG